MKKEAVLILDRSGSMESRWPDTIGGLNSFVRGLRKDDPTLPLTLVAFDNQYEVIFKHRPVNEIKPLKADGFIQPRGTTALYDAIGRTLGQMDADGLTTDDKVIVGILTDGMENASKEFTSESAKKKLTHKQDGGWAFHFMGADLDKMVDGGAHTVGRGLGINTGNASNLCHMRGMADYMAFSIQAYLGDAADATQKQVNP